MRLARIFNEMRNRYYANVMYHTDGVFCEGRIICLGRPIITMCASSKIVLADGVILNSDNFGYHLNMHSPVKLMADRPNSIIKIGKNSRIHGTCIHAKSSIVIGKSCLIAANTQIIDSSGHVTSMTNPVERLKKQDEPKPIRIGDNVWIGAGALLLPGITVSSGTIIAARSVVTNDVAAGCIIGGNPAKVISENLE